MNRKVLHIIDSLGRGGAETLLVGVVKALPDYEHVIVLLKNENQFAGELDGVKIVSLGEKHGLAMLMRWVSEVKRLIRQHSPDVVHGHLYFSSVVARLATPPSTKLLFSNHCLQSYEAFKKPHLVWLERLTYKKRHTLISVSQAVEDDYKRFITIKGEHHVLHNFVEEKFFVPPTGLPSQSEGLPFRCIGVGRLAYQKNWAFLLKVFSQLDSTQFTLDIYGEGPDRAMLQQIITDEGIKNVHLCGLHSNISAVFPDYDLFILSSLYEGHPVSVLEAMAYSLPVALSDIPVMREAGGDAAVYFDLNSPSACATKLMDLATDASKLAAMQFASHSRVSQSARKSQYIDYLRTLYGQ